MLQVKRDPPNLTLKGYLRQIVKGKCKRKQCHSTQHVEVAGCLSTSLVATAINAHV